MKKRFGARIAESLQQALDYLHGDKTKAVESVCEVPILDVKEIRQKIGLSQGEFGDAFAIKTKTIQEWEQHRRIPSGTARVLLAVIKENPGVVQKALRSLGHVLPKKKRKKTDRRSIQAPAKKVRQIDGPSNLKSRTKKFV